MIGVIADKLHLSTHHLEESYFFMIFPGFTDVLRPCRNEKKDLNVNSHVALTVCLHPSLCAGPLDKKRDVSTLLGS
jgi:hypothetical protein